MITTKTGSKDGKLHISYHGYVSTQRATEYPDFVNSWEYAKLQNEAKPGSWTQDEIDSFKAGNNPDKYPNTDWVDLIFKKGTLQTGHNISLSNATKKTDYYLSFGYLYQDGIVMKNNYNRYNLKLNMQNRIFPGLKLTSNISGIQEKDHEPAAPATLDFSNMASIISQVVRVPAIYPNRLSNGDWGTGLVGKGTPGSYFNNESFFKSDKMDLRINERLDWDIIEGLRASLIAGYTESNLKSQRYLAKQRINENVLNGPGNLTQVNKKSQYKTMQELLEYKKRFKKHNISILLGHSFEDTRASSMSGFRNGYTTNDLTQLNAGDVGSQTNTGTANEWALNSYFGRIQYNFAEKYMIEGDLRYDGSSRFPGEKRYATFPAVAIGWRISKEEFIQNNSSWDWLDDLKLTASYGVLGNQNIGNYPFQNIFASGFDYPFGGNISTGYAVETITDSLLHWESTRTRDIGIDATVLKGKLSFGVTYFDKYTYDILVAPSSSVSEVLGFKVGQQNSGKLKNWGWEFNVEHQNVIGDFSYDVNINFSIINNEVRDLGVGNVKQPNGMVGNGTSLFIGYPMNIYYGYVSDGLFVDQDEVDNAPDQTAVNPNPQPGDVKYKDISGPDGKPDGKVTPAYDRTVIGSRIPKYNYGASIKLGYRGFNLSILLQGVADVSGYLSNYAGFAFYNTANIQKWMMEDRWTKENPNPHAGYPRLEILSNAGSPNTKLSSYWIRNASYFRVKNIQLGYTIPDRILQNTVISNLRVYVGAENLYTFNHYPKGWDPEINTGGQYYPILASYTFGINLDF